MKSTKAAGIAIFMLLGLLVATSRGSAAQTAEFTIVGLLRKSMEGRKDAPQSA